MTDPTREFALAVTQRLQEAGFEALWAGGCVRDRLMQVQPHDYDVATNARPDQIRNIFGRRKTLSLGVAFGVITVIGARGSGNVEIATFRSDGHYSDGRHPDEVTFGTAEEDAQRRDFTINGLFYDPVSDRIIDYVGGQADIRDGMVRAIGDARQRIAEDKLRMLRAVRFAATLDFRLDGPTARVICDEAASLGVVSAERINGELTRMLLNRHRRRAVELLMQTGLLVEDCLFPELRDRTNDARETAAVLDQLAALANPEMPECLAILSGNRIPVGDFPATARRLRFSNQVRDTTQWLLQNSGVLGQADQHPWSMVQPLLVDGRIQNALRMLEGLQVCHPEIASSIEFCRERLQWPGDRLDPAPLIDGRDLQQLGIEPGPVFSRILERIRQMQLDGELQDADTARQRARQLAGED